MTKILDFTDTTVTTREYGKKVTSNRFRAVVNDGRGLGWIYDKVTDKYVTEVVGVHTEAEALAAFAAERR